MFFQLVTLETLVFDMFTGRKTAILLPCTVLIEELTGLTSVAFRSE